MTCSREKVRKTPNFVNTNPKNVSTLFAISESFSNTTTLFEVHSIKAKKAGRPIQ